jgi:hypothetical protein
MKYVHMLGENMIAWSNICFQRGRKTRLHFPSVHMGQALNPELQFILFFPNLNNQLMQQPRSEEANKKITYH